MTAGALIWTHALVRAIQMETQPNRQSRDSNPWAEISPDEPALSDEEEVGQRRIRGSQSHVSRMIARAILAQNVPGSFAPLFEVTERTDQRVVVKRSTTIACNQPPGMQFSEVEFNLMPLSSDAVDVEYRIRYGQLRRRLRRLAMILILAVGLPVILIGGSLIWVFFVNSGSPVMRWQVLQSLQIVHVLWPPFAVLNRYKSGREHSRTFVSNLMTTAELAESASAIESLP